MAVATTPPEDFVPPFGGDEWPFLNYLGGRPETASRVHRVLAKRPRAAVDIDGYLREIAEGLVAARGIANRTELRFVADSRCLMTQPRALMLGLIVGELVANAIVYAHPTGVHGRLDVACRLAPNRDVTITIEDDGVGLPDGLDPMTEGQSGLQLVRNLAARLDAALSFYSDALGLAVLLRIPATAKQ